MTGNLSASERGDVAEAMLPTAAHLVALVHGDGGPSEVGEVLAKLTPLQKDALLVVLAGLVNPDQPLSAALGWLDFDEYGHTVVPPWGERTRVRDLAPEPALEENDVGHVDDIAVRKYAEGIRVAVTARERLAAVVVCVARGLTYLDIDAMHGLKKNSTATFISRTRRAYELRGEKFPEIVRPDATRVLTEAEVVEIRERSHAGATDLALALSYGVNAKAISDVCRGRSYQQYGGPIRQPKKNTPGRNTRVVWAHGNERFAQAS
ncbi:hypothetical protein [Streptomyces sp. NPDC059071]|uniref:hypothetical protein n=1 Tax=unclassified Streptomyces TaxID=2593676 RepID=UPI00364C99BC